MSAPQPAAPGSAARRMMGRQAAIWRATRAVRQLLAQSKNPKTTLGRMSATGVAYHAAWKAIEIWEEAQEQERARERTARARQRD